MILRDRGDRVLVRRWVGRCKGADPARADEDAIDVKRPGHRVRIVSLLTIVVACRARAPEPAPAGDAWSTMGWEERHDVMTFTVLPNMARLFQRFHGSADPDMTCATCHGADAELVHYAMPHGLPALDATHLPDPKGADPREARMAKFMNDEVMPAMADLIGVRPAPDRDPKHGLSCFTCHPSR